MSFVKEFKEFALKGNVIDLAVGVIIGGAFNSIVTGVINDLVMPVIGIFFHADFSNLYVGLNDKVRQAIEAHPDMALADARKIGPVFAWGDFISIVINFLILALIIFLMVKGINSLKRKHEEAPPAPAAPTPTEQLLMEIRDELKKR